MLEECCGGDVGFLKNEPVNSGTLLSYRGSLIRNSMCGL